MILKHVLHGWRNFTITVVQLLLPGAFAFFSCLATLYSSKIAEPVPLALTLDNLPDGPVYYISVGSGTVAPSLAKVYADVVREHTTPVDAKVSNMDDYLLDIAKHSMKEFERQYVAATMNTSSDNYGELTYISGHFNNFFLHAIAISLSLVDNTLLHYVEPASPTIVTVNHPLPWSFATRSQKAKDSMVGTLLALYVVLGLVLVAGIYVLFPVGQYTKKSKHLQLVSGVGVIIYWMTAFVWNLVKFFISSVLIIVVVLAFKANAFSTWPVTW